MQLFYDGLKEEVRDELYQKDRPETLVEYIPIAIRIGNRQYSRKQQKKGGLHGSYAAKANDKKMRQQGSTHCVRAPQGTHELDTTQAATWTHLGPEACKTPVVNCTLAGDCWLDGCDCAVP